MARDSRKEFLLASVSNHFNVCLQDSNGLYQNESLNNFLDDESTTLLTCFVKGSNKQIVFSNNVDKVHSELLIFFKLRLEVITPDNLHDNICISSIIGSPFNTLYHVVKNLYAPVFLEDTTWNKHMDPQLQKLLSELMAGLKSSLRKQNLDSGDRKDEDLNEHSFGGIVTPEDEFHFWNDIANSKVGNEERERAQHFRELCGRFCKDYGSGLDSLEMQTVLELIETTQDNLDDIWKQSEFEPVYPEKRMKHFMEVIASSIGRYVKKKLADEDIWNGYYPDVCQVLQYGVTICETWLNSCETLTHHWWRYYTQHRWTGDKYVPTDLSQLSNRINEVLTMRSIHEQLTHLLSSQERQELNMKNVFRPFSGLNPILYNPFTRPLWDAAVMQFNATLTPIEHKVASVLKQHVQEVEGNLQQLLWEFHHYKDLIKRPAISKEMLSQRETLLALLTRNIKQIMEEFNARTNLDNPKVPKGKNLPDIVNLMIYVRQLEARVESNIDMTNTVLSDLSNYEAFKRVAGETLTELRKWRKEQFEDWSDRMSDMINNLSQPLSVVTNSCIMEMTEDMQLKVNYDERLVTLLREVRMLSALGFSIPGNIQETARTAEKFYKHGIVLKQVAHFYNTIDQQMIQSQKPMMVASARAFEALILKPKENTKGRQGITKVTWDDPNQLEAYIERLQKAAERLTSENRRLRQYHSNICDKVQQLMHLDLLRQQQRWKDCYMEIKHVLSAVANQGYSNDCMTAWRIHWNYQLYKTLEHQYQQGLEGLNTNIAEIKVELVFRHQRLQFSPSFEQIKQKYSREMKKFLSIPYSFVGVADTSRAILFRTIVDRNVRGFVTCYRNMDSLFKQLRSVYEQFKEWVALGCVDINDLADQCLVETSDWERNIKALKIRSRNADKLPNQVKVGCITVNTSPVKIVIDELIQQLFDALVSCLQRKVGLDVKCIDSFLTEAIDKLTCQPSTMEEVTAANKCHLEYEEKKKEMKELFEKAQVKNKLLRSFAGQELDSLMKLASHWDSFELILDSHSSLIAKRMDVMKSNLQTDIASFHEAMQKFSTRWGQIEQNLSFEGDITQCDQDLDIVKEKLEDFNKLCETRDSLSQSCEQFHLPVLDSTQVDDLKERLANFEGLVGVYSDYKKEMEALTHEDWLTFGKKMHLFEEFINKWFEKLQSLPVNTLIARLVNDIDKYRNVLPQLKWVRGDQFSPSHLVELNTILQLPQNTKPEKVTFGMILNSSDNIIKNVDALQELNRRAQGEIIIRDSMREIEMWGVAASFSLTDYQDTDKTTVKLIKGWKDIFNEVGDQQCLLQSLKDSPYFKNFLDKATIWEKRLASLDENLQNLNQIQHKWVYLEPIFGRGALPKEQSRFKRVDTEFRSIMCDIVRDRRYVSLANKPGLTDQLRTMVDQLLRCQKALNEFLEEKRSSFPRFYFIGDEDLLEILGQSTKPDVIQTHLKKLFSGIHTVQFNEDCTEILAMKSLHGEVVPLRHQVPITTDVEQWMNSLATEMKETLKQLLKECLLESRTGQPDLDKYPSQVLCLVEQIQFTEDCEAGIKRNNLNGFLQEVRRKLDVLTGRNIKCSEVLDLKMKALILDMVHGIDIVQQLIAANVTSVNDWQWQKQLRFYIQEKNLCAVKMVDATFNYTFEYQGNLQKLVHTPLTDKCYLTLTQGMHMGLGGNPYGPAGTGKTESVKALGGLFGRQVLVFNCDESLDVKSMGRIFIGLVKCGAWGCFDEFNRLEPPVLSAVSMQIQVIQDAIKCKAAQMELLGKNIEIDHNSGIFITMNPAGKGYGGRQKLPDNLKQLFRPVAMSKPDNEQIAEVILFSNGFKEAKTIGRKLVTVFNLSKQLLTPQQHYDWGLRAMKTVLQGCASLLQKARSDGVSIDESVESVLVVQALRFNTLSKLTFSDSSMFDSLIRDIFPGVSFKDIQFEDIAEAFRAVCEEQKLIIDESQVKKALELYEQLKQRMGIVIVGPSGSGKSTLWSVLRQALAKIGQTVKQYTMNPKAMPRTQLLGHIDMDTREWTDGVLTNSARQVVKEPLDIHSWIICDGDIDPEWIESLNSVLDDNRLLTMPSGERIQFGPNVNFIFETHDLVNASPATISR
ncbi:hypothetical protein Ahia01_000603700, partial [Argonauta hians]